jgi:cytochrome c oxidase subunit I
MFRSQRLVLCHFWAAFAAFIPAIFLGAFQMLARSPWLEVHDPRVYYSSVTAHGSFFGYIFPTFLAMGFGYAICANSLAQRLKGRRFAWLGFILMLLGSVAALLPELLGKSATLYTFYLPLMGNTWYYVGLILVILGSWVWVVVMLANLTVWKVRHRNVPVPLAMFASCAGGLLWFWTSLGVTIELLGSVVPYLLGWTTTIDAGLGRVLFSWTLHGIVYFWLIPSYVAFYTMVPQQADARLYSDTMGRLTFILFLVFSVPVGMHHVFGDPEVGGGPKFVHALFTALVAVPTLLTVFSISASLEIGGRLRGGKGLFGWIGALPWERPMVLACGLSLIMLGLGGVGGLINMSYGLDNTIHNTQWVTAHFHLIYGGAIVIMYFAIAYELWPWLTGRPLFSVRLARWQLWLWFIGLMVTTIPWHLVGLMGQPRRMAFFDYHNPAIAPQAPYVAVSVLGALFIVLSSVLLIVNLLATHFQPRQETSNRVRFALAVNPPLRVPRVLNGFAVWNALLFVLMIVNYGIPLTQVLFLKQSHRTAPFAVGDTAYREK